MIDLEKNLSESSNIEISTNIPEGENPSMEEKLMPKRSRLNKSFQRKSRNTFILSVLAIVLILIALLKFGLPLISDASFLFGKATNLTKNEEIDKKIEVVFVPIPNLDELPSATKEKTVIVSGNSISGLTILLFLNGKKIEEIKTSENGDFEKEITLSEGENIIKAKAVKENSESDFSNSISIAVKNKGPELSIDSPSDGAQISGSNPVEIKGKTDPDSSVLVNDFQAISNSNGDWSYFLTLKGGENEIKAISTDLAGNKTEKIIRVNYAQ